MSATRRQVLAHASALGAGITFTGALSELFAGTAAAQSLGHTGYGSLVADPNGLLDLPKGFRYTVLSREGDQLRSGEGRVPSNHDGMAAFGGRGGRTHLVRNHENRVTAQIAVPTVSGLTYDPAGKGGCTALTLDADHRVLSERVAIAGTAVNCAGGRTPWGTWLTCEETEDKAGKNGFTKDHGYVFEVDPEDRRANRDPKPIKALGRYAHEAVVVDPKRGHLYLTEDASGPNGLFYRWTPPEGFRHGRGRLRTLADDAGVLQAFKCFDSGGTFVDDLSRATRIGTVFGVDWVDVPDRDARTVSVRKQFTDGQVTRARKLEGMWWGDGGVYVVSSFARQESPVQHDGQVWFYDPKRRTLTLKVLLGVNPDPARDGNFDGPDNITVSPYGGLVIAEDGEGVQHLFGATESGRTYPIARNELNIGTAEEPEYSEFTGVTFSPDGRTLFANIQTPGIMLAITGPWKRQKCD